MTDYTHATGSTGTMIIRDNGSTITFLLENTYASTWVNGLSWSGTINGTPVGGTLNISGAETVTVGSWTVSSSQTVTFGIGASGTSGIGGPTSFSAAISRASAPTVKVPGAPGTPSISAITQTSAKVSFSAAAANGGTIDQYQIMANGGTDFKGGSGTTISPLQPNTAYIVQVRAHNSAGWGPWSGKVGFETVAGAWVLVNGTWTKAVPYVCTKRTVASNGMVTQTWALAQPYVRNGSGWTATS